MNGQLLQRLQEHLKVPASKYGRKRTSGKLVEKVSLLRMKELSGGFNALWRSFWI